MSADVELKYEFENTYRYAVVRAPHSDPSLGTDAALHPQPPTFSCIGYLPLPLLQCSGGVLINLRWALPCHKAISTPVSAEAGVCKRVCMECTARNMETHASFSSGVHTKWKQSLRTPLGPRKLATIAPSAYPPNLPTSCPSASATSKPGTTAYVGSICRYDPEPINNKAHRECRINIHQPNGPAVPILRAMFRCCTNSITPPPLLV